MLLWAAFAWPSVPLPAQQVGPARIGAETEFQKEPNGTALGRLVAGAAVTTTSLKGNWAEVRFDGWLAAKALRDDRRDGYDVAVALAAGSTLRSSAGGGSTIASLRAGALFKRLETKGEWVRVQRSAWILKSAFKADAGTPPQAPATVGAKPLSAPSADSTPKGSTLSGGATLAATSGGAPVATFEIAVPATVLERKGGWAKVQVEGWVREGSLGGANPDGGPSAADIRANPDRYLGQTVEWTIQVLSIQKADELRPELPPGQPYVLARGPIPETGFVYLVVSAKDAELFRAMEPLAKLRIRATIRAGRSRFLPTPVLTFVRRLD
jgi:SH3-like domain-containing protein